MCKCIVCGYSGDAKLYEAKEMMYGMGNSFTYFECPECGCLQIKDIPDNLGDYYQKDYYSYRKPDNSTSKHAESINETRVLDVGCGGGALLCELAEFGYIHLHGCDPYLDSELIYENGVHIFNKEIHDIEGEYDLIIMSDSFEHVTDPHDVLESAYRLLAPEGTLRIGIPIYPNIAFDMFGANWYQLDAPRHIVLNSKKSMVYFAEKHGFKIFKGTWNSSSAQIVRSFLYEKGIPFVGQTQEIIEKYFTAESLQKMKENSEIANKNQYGDHVVFDMIKKEYAAQLGIL